MNQLQKSLRINAIFSGISGITLIVFNQQIAQLFGVKNGTTFWIIGIVLIYFTSTIIYEIFKQRPLAVLWIIIQDFLWVLGSIVLLLLKPFEISKPGNTTITLIAFFVLFMGVNQSKALAQIDSSSQKGNKKFRFERIVKANKHDVWKIISDVANYDKFAPNIDKVKIISGEKQGLVRSCSKGNNNWIETCTLWEDEKKYSFEVNTTAPDYSFPFKFLNGAWEIEKIDIGTTKIIMVFEFQYKRKYQNWLLHPLLKRKFKRTAKKLLDNWQYELEIK